MAFALCASMGLLAFSAMSGMGDAAPPGGDTTMLDVVAAPAGPSPLPAPEVELEALAVGAGEPDAPPVTVAPVDRTARTARTARAAPKARAAATRPRRPTRPAPAPAPPRRAAPAATATTAKPKATTTTTQPGNLQEGGASWYESAGPGTCAHRSLPMGTEIQVTSTATGKSVSCRVADRGPYVDGRVVDLAKDEFSALAPEGAGVVHVRIEW